MPRHATIQRIAFTPPAVEPVQPPTAVRMKKAVTASGPQVL
jgi:hypothetical protein